VTEAFMGDANGGKGLREGIRQTQGVGFYLAAVGGKGAAEEELSQVFTEG
jgi:hypothetical protein